LLLRLILRLLETTQLLRVRFTPLILPRIRLLRIRLSARSWSHAAGLLLLRGCIARWCVCGWTRRETPVVRLLHGLLHGLFRQSPLTHCRRLSVSRV
jgi:hypothetical protein